MEHLEWDQAEQAWRYQELALFARRAHKQLGRGFVFVESGDPQPVYVTRVLGGPQPLIDAVYGYDPDREALVVSSDDEADDEGVIINLVKIERPH